MKTTTALQEHQIAIEDALVFITAGHASFTFRSQSTGTRYTYKVIRGDRNPSKLICYVLTGPTTYSFFGIITVELVGYTFEISPKSHLDAKAPSVEAFRWVINKLIQKRNINHLEIWHEGRCGVCGRPLTDPESIKSGIGPYCASKM